MPISDAMLIGMSSTNPLAEKMLDQRTNLRNMQIQLTRLEGELEGSERTVRNLQHELDIAHAEIARLRSLT